MSRSPFDAGRAAMLLLAALILTGCAISLLVSVRCTVWPNQQCAEQDWGTVIREWLGETIPALIAIAMAWRNLPPPPPSPPAKGEPSDVG